MASAEENKALVRYYFDELEAGNLDVIDEVFADEFTAEYDVVRSDIDDVSRESMDAVLEELFTAFPDTSIASQQLFAEEDSVIFMQTWEATHQGEYRGIAPSGNEVSYEFWGRFVIEDEQIVHADVIADEFRLFTQLGLELSIEGYRKLIETAPDPIVITDIETGRVLETNSTTEHELSVLEAEQETALSHGSGIGLWLIHWGMNAIRGDVSFESTEQGARVTLHVPSLESAVNMGV